MGLTRVADNLLKTRMQRLATFAIATRDELWVNGRLVERRLSHGEAFEDERGIVATDARRDELVEHCDHAMDSLRTCVRPDLRIRLVAEATPDCVTHTVTATLGAHSLVTNEEHFDEDLALLRRAALPAEATPPRLPIVWRNGSAAVLLHEALGHPAEHGHDPLEWPPWLHVDNPLAPRRATFRDVPLLRMTKLVARQSGASMELPEERIEVLLVDSGAYEPLTQEVTLRIGAADLIEGARSQRVAPFALTTSRNAIARALVGAAGEPIRYPGVVCSREGQELVVASHAPLMLTEPL